MQEFLRKYGLPLAVVLLVVAGVAAYFAMRPKNVAGTQMAFYVDEETGQETVLPMAQFPPLLNASGKPTMVRVVKFSCDGGATVKVGYYEKYAPEAKAKLDKNDDPSGNIALKGLFVRSPEKDSPWVPQTSKAGEEVMQRAICDDPKKLTFVGPPPG
jgi:hypothetical protein